MKILYISDLGFEGYLPPQIYSRPPLTWIHALGAYHIHHSKINTIQENFDIAIIASLHENINIQNINMNDIKKIAKKIGIQQESHHRNYLTAKGIIDSIYFISLYQNCDFILTHNEIDSKYFNSLFNKPVFHHPQLLDLDISLYNKKEEIILPGNLDFRYGNFDNYLIGLETGLPINIPKMHTYRAEESYLENIIHHSYEPDYIKFNKMIGTSKYSLYLIPYPLGGSFPIQCAMMKTPCLSWNTSQTALDLYPELSFEYGDFSSVKIKLKELIQNQSYIDELNDYAYKIVLDKYTNIDYYKQYMFNILNNIK
jgi:hypothetical protein